MPHLREEADADYMENCGSMTDYRTQLNKHEVLCGSCGRTVFVDDEINEQFHRAIEHGQDNQLVCDQCREESDDLAYTVH